MSKFDGNKHSQPEIDNRANQLNPNNPAYSSSRSGYSSSYYSDDEDDFHIHKFENSQRLKTRESQRLLTSYHDEIIGGEMKFVKIPAGCKVYEEGCVRDVERESFFNLGAVFSISGHLLEEDRKITAPELGSTLFEAKKGDFYHVILKKQKFLFDENHTELFIPTDMKTTFDSIMDSIC